MKIYLAGPMRGIPNSNFPAFNRAAEFLRARGHEVFNPAEKEAEVGSNDLIGNLDFRRKVFGLDWAWIAVHADAVALLPGWERSRGAVSERACANALGIRVIYLGQEDGWKPMSTTEIEYKHFTYAPVRARDKEASQTEPPKITAPVTRRALSDASSDLRKRYPMCTGLIDYFPDALAEVARMSYEGNEKHNPGQPLHWARGKSTDHADCIVRHLTERGGFDGDVRHSTAMAWRALALLQEELEAEKGYSKPRRAIDAEGG